MVLHDIKCTHRYLLFFICFFYWIGVCSCASKNERKDDITKPESNHSDAITVKAYINSLDISLELKDSVFFEDVYVLEMMITNNSEYQLMDSDFQIQYFDSGSWRQRELKNTANIKTGANLMKVNPHSKEPYIYYPGLPITKQGRYRLKITFDLLIPNVQNNTNPLRVTVSDEFIISSK